MCPCPNVPLLSGHQLHGLGDPSRLPPPLQDDLILTTQGWSPSDEPWEALPASGPLRDRSQVTPALPRLTRSAAQLLPVDSGHCLLPLPVPEAWSGPEGPLLGCWGKLPASSHPPLSSTHCRQTDLTEPSRTSHPRPVTVLVSPLLAPGTAPCPWAALRAGPIPGEALFLVPFSQRPPAPVDSGPHCHHCHTTVTALCFCVW